MAFDAKRLTPLDWGVIGAGALAFISLFLPWWGVTFGPFSASVSGWSTGYGILGALLLLASGAWWFLYRAEVQLPKLPVSALVVTLAASALGFLLIVIRWLTLPRGGYLTHSFNYGGRAGIWMAAIVGAIQLACGAMLFRQSGEQLPWKAASAPGAPPPA